MYNEIHESYFFIIKKLFVTTHSQLKLIISLKLQYQMGSNVRVMCWGKSVYYQAWQRLVYVKTFADQRGSSHSSGEMAAIVSLGITTAAF